MRIAVVTTSYPHFEGDPSGHFVEAEARALAQRGDEVTVLWPRDVAAFGWPGMAARVRARPWLAASAAAWVIRARGQIADGRFDRIIAHWAVPCAWPIAAGGNVTRANARRAELEVVSHGGDVRLLARMPSRLRSVLVGKIAERAIAWRFVSSALFGDLVRALPAHVAARVDAIARVEACAIAMPDVSRAIAAKRHAMREGLPADAKVAVCVGRLVASKRVDAAIAYAAARGIHLVVIGDGPERARLEALAARLGASVHSTSSHSVRFAGLLPREETLAAIGAADELLHASKAEGLSTVVREAEALGTRVTSIA